MYCWNGTGSAFSHTLGPTFQVVCAYSQTLGEGGYVYPVRGWLECMDSLRRLKKWHHRLWHALLQSGLNSVQSIEYLPNGSTWHGLIDEHLVFAGKYRPNVLPTRENRSLYRIVQFRRSITKRNEFSNSTQQSARSVGCSRRAGEELCKLNCVDRPLSCREWAFAMTEVWSWLRF